VPAAFAAALCRALPALAIALAAGLAAAQDSPTLRRIRDTGVVTLGHRVSSVPFSYLDARRRPVGYSIDICERVVEAIRQRLGDPSIETRLVMVSSATRVPMLANSTIDLECGVTTNTAERQKQVAFSITTFVAASRLLSRQGSNIRGLDDLRGQTVATTVSTTSIQFLGAANQARGLDMKILAGADDADGFQMVRTGRAAAFAMDDVLLRGLLATAPDARDYGISAEALTVEPYAIGLNRDDPVFKQLVDGVISELFRSGQIHAIYRKWFESPIPPQDINLRLPMSEALQRVIQRPIDSPDPAAYR
jgi:glutamate/aspartate transport system substrate-binding protein